MNEDRKNDDLRAQCAVLLLMSPLRIMSTSHLSSVVGVPAAQLGAILARSEWFWRYYVTESRDARRTYWYLTEGGARSAASAVAAAAADAARGLPPDPQSIKCRRAK